MAWAIQPHQLFQPAARPVAVDRLADPLAGREAEPRRRPGRLLVVRLALLRPRLKHEPRRDKTSAALNPEVLGALRQSS